MCVDSYFDPFILNQCQHGNQLNTGVSALTSTTVKTITTVIITVLLGVKNQFNSNFNSLLSCINIFLQELFF